MAMMSVELRFATFALLCLVSVTNSVNQVQQWDNAIDSVKRDITELAGRFKGSALYEGISKAVNISLSALEIHEKAVTHNNITVLHIIEKLSLKRLYRIISAHHQLIGYTHQIIYWIPSDKRSESTHRDIAVLYDVLPAQAVRVVDLLDFSGAERDFMGSDRCSGSLCYELLAAKVRNMKMIESNIIIGEQNDIMNFWLLNIDMNWVGNIGDILQKLTPFPTSKTSFSSLLNRVDDDGVGVVKTNGIDYLAACVGDRITKRSASPESKSSIEIVYDRVMDDIEKLTSDASKVLTEAVEVITVLLVGNDSSSHHDKTQPTQPFCWPEISKFSGRFLDTLHNATFNSGHGAVLLSRGVEYWQLVNNHQLNYHNVLDIGLRDGLLARDFIPENSLGSDLTCRSDGSDAEKNEKNSTCTRNFISEKEFELLKSNFLEKAAEPFVFEGKAGTLFRNIDGISF